MLNRTDFKTRNREIADVKKYKRYEEKFSIWLHDWLQDWYDDLNGWGNCRTLKRQLYLVSGEVDHMKDCIELLKFHGFSVHPDEPLEIDSLRYRHSGKEEITFSMTLSF